MDDELVAQFTAITGATPDRATQYLRLTDADMQQAIDLFFASDGVDLEGGASAVPTQTAPPIPHPSTRPVGHSSVHQDESGVIHIDSDEELSDGDEPEITG